MYLPSFWANSIYIVNQYLIIETFTSLYIFKVNDLLLLFVQSIRYYLNAAEPFIMLTMVLCYFIASKGNNS